LLTSVEITHRDDLQVEKFAVRDDAFGTALMTDFHRFMPVPLRERLKKSSQGIQNR
jgi:hypothetical protein